MRMTDAIESYIRDMRGEGRINSRRTEDQYRYVLGLHADDTGNRDPAKTGREDIKRTLGRWENPNTRGVRHAVLASFYKWAVENGIRPHNPALQIRRPKKRQTSVYRLSRTEALAMMDAAQGTTERRVIHLGLLAGLRATELVGMQGLHFQRDGWIHVTDDLAKGTGKARWIKVLEELEPVVDDIRSTVAPAHFALPRGLPRNKLWTAEPRHDLTQPMNRVTAWRIVGRVAKRAGIGAHIHTHLLRHAFADHVARHVSLVAAQALMGHADIATTRGYTGDVSLEELAAQLHGVRYRALPLDEEGVSRAAAWAAPQPGLRDRPEPTEQDEEET